jgi:hypothetical protein
VPILAIRSCRPTCGIVRPEQGFCVIGHHKPPFQHSGVLLPPPVAGSRLNS